MKLFTETDVMRVRSSPLPRPGQLELLLSHLECEAAGDGASIHDIRVYVLLRDGLACRICGRPIRPGRQVIDHVSPICLGGDNDWENLRVVHGFCNNSRGPHRNGALHSDNYVRSMMAVGIELGHRDEFGEHVR